MILFGIIVIWFVVQIECESGILIPGKTKIFPKTT